MVKNSGIVAKKWVNINKYNSEQQGNAPKFECISHKTSAHFSVILSKIFEPIF